MDQIRHVLLMPVVLLIILNLELFDNGVLVRAQHQRDSSSSGDMVSNFQPSLAVVIGILSIMFSITFILLIYAKFCHRGGWANGSLDGRGDNNAFTRSRRFSGINKTVIESLPFFRFSSLRGSRAGLECSVCLSKFEDIEILRLLPKCKHAFHIDCIDHWLERHSTCPLCRHRVSPDDPSIFAYSNSMRLLTSNQPERIDQDQDSLGIFIEREEENRSNKGSSLRFNIGTGSSFRRLFKGSNNSNSGSSGKDEESQIIREGDKQKTLHKFNHKIVVSDVVFQNRWSNVSSSDLMFLNSEMLNALSSDRFSSLESYEENPVATDGLVENERIGKIKEEMDRKRLLESKLSSINKTSLISPGPSTTPVPSSGDQSSQPNGSKLISEAEKRSQSEITAVSRFERYSGGNRKQERRRQLWLPIATRTVQWFGNRERRSPSHHRDSQNTNTTQIPDSTPV